MFAFSLSLLLFIFLSISCEKADEVDSEFNDSYASLYNLISSNENQILTFENRDSYLNFLKLLNNMDFQELNSLNFGIYTYRDYITEKLLPFNDFETREDFVNYISLNSHIFELLPTPNGEEKVEIINEPLDNTGFFLNENQLVKIGSTYYKYFDNFLVYSDNENELISVSSEEDIGRLNHITTFDKSHGTSVRNDYNVEIVEEKIKNKPFCKNDRKAVMRCIVRDVEFFPGSTGNDLRKIVSVYGVTKGIPCIWYRYTTIVRRNNFRFENEYGNSLLDNWTLPNVEADTYELLDAKTLLSYTGFYPTNRVANCWVFIEITRIIANINTRGLGGLWLNVDLF